MPNRIKIMSWNLRTYGYVAKTAEVVRVIAKTILESRADIVCIQELMCGDQNFNVGDPIIGAPISAACIQRFNSIIQDLHHLDAPANWDSRITGRNAGQSLTHSADAYGFLWKRAPVLSQPNFRHGLPATPATTIGLTAAPPAAPPNNPGILNVANFPNRRPGQLRLTIDWVAPGGMGVVLNLSLISFHATTPTNVYKVFVRANPPGGRVVFNSQPAAGTAIQWLGRIPEVAPVPPALPAVNTIILGDFNYELSAARRNPYTSLTDNGYVMGIINPVTKTTYRPNGADPDRFVSSYDNIFHIGPNLQLVAGSGQNIDFIRDQSLRLINPVTLVASHDRYYGIQYGKGVSDHLPVVAEYNVM